VNKTLTLIFQSSVFFSIFYLPVHAGYGGIGNIETDDNGALGGPEIIVFLAGALIGYFAERAYNKAKLDKSGAKYSSEYLGGKLGAIVGAIALPLLIGLLR
jgi:hypothetical protein